MRCSAFGACVCGFVLAAVQICAAATQMGMEPGAVELKSAGPLTFGMQGVLFAGDPAAASVFALSVDDKAADPNNVTINVPDLNARVAEALKVDAKQVQINRLAVNPTSGNVYLTVTAGEPKQVSLVRVDGSGQVQKVALENIKYAKAQLPAPPTDAANAANPRRGNPRAQSINDIAWTEGKVMVAGLAGENPLAGVQEIPFPFTDGATWSNVEIFHGSHGRVEDAAPVRAMVPFKVGGEPVLLTGFTCTPLVMFPLNTLEPGKKVHGKTIAELGNGNTPIAMFIYNKDGKDYLLMSNTNHGLMKISTEGIQENAGINAPVRGTPTAGQPFESIKSLKGVLQMDRLNEGHFVYLTKTADGTFALQTADLP